MGVEAITAIELVGGGYTRDSSQGDGYNHNLDFRSGSGGYNRDRTGWVGDSGYNCNRSWGRRIEAITAIYLSLYN